MIPATWTEIKVAEDATPFKEHFVAFRSNTSFHNLIELFEISSTEGRLKIGYVNHSMCGWQTYPREVGYSMNFLVSINRTSSVYAQAALINSNLKIANLFFRYLTPEELKTVYLMLFVEKTGKMNSSVGGIYLLSIKNQLRKEKSNIELYLYNYYLYKYTDESLWSKYEYPNE